MRVRIKDNVEEPVNFRGRIGTVIGKGRQTVTSGKKKRIITDYIVQFTRPAEWSWFSRNEFVKLKGKADGK